MSLTMATLRYPRGKAYHHFGVRNPGEPWLNLSPGGAAASERAASPPVQLISRQSPPSGFTRMRER
jgi:hypothetical protein